MKYLYRLLSNIGIKAFPSFLLAFKVFLSLIILARKNLQTQQAINKNEFPNFSEYSQ